MAIYRNISLSFWTDRKIDEEFTPEDKYFYLYLLSNPHTNICGCYEITLRQMSNETGYTESKIKHLLEKLDKVHNVIRYDKKTKEVLIINFSKYNWSSSDKFIKAIFRVGERIKSPTFKKIIFELANNNILPKDIYNYSTVTVTVTETDTVSDTDTDTDTVVCIPYAYGMDTVSAKSKKDEIQANIKNYTDNEELQDALREFVKMRKAIKHPLTDRALTLSLNKLDKLGKDDKEKVAIVNQSIERGWKGFFPIGETQTQPDSSTDIDEYKSVINKFLY